MPSRAARKTRALPARDEEEPGEFALDDEEAVAVEDVEEEEEPSRTVVKEKMVPAAPWGAMPVVFMLPCVIVMFLVAMLGFELLQSMSGNYKSPGLLTRTIGDILGQKFK